MTAADGTVAVQLVSPNGAPILGTLETVQALQRCGSWYPKEDGSGWAPAEPGPAGIYWETSEAVEHRGEKILVDGNGDRWPETLCRPAGEEPPETDDRSETIRAVRAAVRAEFEKIRDQKGELESDAALETIERFLADLIPVPETDR